MRHASKRPWASSTTPTCRSGRSTTISSTTPSTPKLGLDDLGVGPLADADTLRRLSLDDYASVEIAVEPVSDEEPAMTDVEPDLEAAVDLPTDSGLATDIDVALGRSAGSAADSPGGAVADSAADAYSDAELRRRRVLRRRAGRCPRHDVGVLEADTPPGNGKTDDEIEQLLGNLAPTRPERRFGASSTAAAEALRPIQASKKRLGEIIVDMGLATDEQIDRGDRPSEGHAQAPGSAPSRSRGHQRARPDQGPGCEAGGRVHRPLRDARSTWPPPTSSPTSCAANTRPSP